MPTISIFFGMVIEIYWRDHPPPHFHVIYGEHEAVVEIATGEVMHGRLPPGARRVVTRWTERHRVELLANWDRARLRVPSGRFRERMKMSDTSQIEFVKVVELTALGGYRVWVRFSNGREGIRDFSDMIAEGGEMVEPLRDEAVFMRVVVRHGVLAWPNGFDIDATNLHMEMKATGALSKIEAAE